MADKPTKRLAAVSGGAHSTAMALYMADQGEDFDLMFADTGAELPENYWLLPRLAKHLGRELHVVSGGSMFQWLNSFGYMLPSPKFRWCTRILKQAPQDYFAEAHAATEVCVGIRADEPRRQKKWKPRSGDHAFRWPLVEACLGKEDVLAICRKAGLLNPVYDWRSSVSCFCCPFQRKGDWLGLLKHHPTLFKVAEEWEERSIEATVKGFTWGYRPLKVLRKMDEEQLRLWPEPREEPCLICQT